MPGDEPVFSFWCMNNCLIVYCSLGIVCHDQCQCTLGNSIHKRQALYVLSLMCEAFMATTHNSASRRIA